MCPLASVTSQVDYTINEFWAILGLNRNNNGLTIARITTEMVSERRNELLAEMLQRVRLTEKWGRGIKLILSKEPGTIFKEIGSHFIAVFRRKEETREKKVTGKVTERVTENQKRILSEITRNVFVSAMKLSAVVGISERKIKENIKKLKRKGALRRVGPDKGGHWEVLK